MKYRINEAKCRYRNFKSMGILFPVGWMFVLRPIVACFIPSKLLAWAKHRKALGLKEINSGGVNANEKKDNLNIDKIVCDNAGSRL